MKKLIKILVYILAVGLPLLVVSGIAAIYFIDPNLYKNKITQVISEKTGQELTIDGDLSLKFYPWLGISAKNVSLKNPDGFSQNEFIKITQAGFKVETLPLLKSKIKLSALLLDNPVIYLEHKKDGSNNWEVMLKNIKKNYENSDNSSENSKSNNNAGASKFEFQDIASIKITNANLNFINQESGENITLTDFNFDGTNINVNKPFKVKGKYTLDIISKNKADVTKQTADFSGDCNINLKDNNYIVENTKLNMVFSGDKIPNKKLSLSIQTKLMGDFDKSRVKLEQLTLKADELLATGSAMIDLANLTNSTFDLNIDKLDLNKFKVSNFELNPESKTSASNTENSLQPQILKVAFENKASGSDGSGKLNIGSLSFKNYILTNFKTTTSVKNSIIYLDPLSANIYNGTINSKTNIDVQNHYPKISTKGSVSNISVANLLEAMSGSANVTGTATVNFDLNSSNNVLNGTSNFNVQNGTLKKVDIAYFFDMAGSLLKKEATKSQNNGYTEYKSITGTLVTTNNIVSNNDMHLDSANFEADGSGTIDLIQQTINYKILAKKKYNDGASHENALPLAIKISGSINDPKVTPDLDAYVAALVKDQVQKKITDKIGDKIGKILGGPSKDDGTAPTDNGGDSGSNPIEKGLKKIFKF